MNCPQFDRIRFRCRFHWKIFGKIFCWRVKRYLKIEEKEVIFGGSCSSKSCDEIRSAIYRIISPLCRKTTATSSSNRMAKQCDDFKWGIWSLLLRILICKQFTAHPTKPIRFTSQRTSRCYFDGLRSKNQDMFDWLLGWHQFESTWRYLRQQPLQLLRVRRSDQLHWFLRRKRNQRIILAVRRSKLQLHRDLLFSRRQRDSNLRHDWQRWIFWNTDLPTLPTQTGPIDLRYPFVLYNAVSKYISMFDSVEKGFRILCEWTFTPS